MDEGARGAPRAVNEYVVTPVDTGPLISGLVFDTITGDMSFTVPSGYTLFSVEGADLVLELLL